MRNKEMPLWLMAVAMLVVLSGCKQQSVQSGYHNDYVIGRYTSSPWGFNTNSFWVEGPDGVILIDTQFLPSAAMQAVDIAESYTGKKVVLAVVLHANPDKFNGTKALTERGIKVITSEQVRALIPGVDKKRRSWFYERYAPDYPDTLVLPQSYGAAAVTEINAAGLTLKLHTLGAAVSEAHVVVELDGHLFVGDLVANQNHAWMELGLSDQWIAALQQLQSLKPTQIHPGRGYAQGAELLQQQIDYLRFVQQTVQQFFNGQPLTDAVKADIVSAIEKQYPGYGFEYFLNLGIPAEYARLLK